MSWNDSFINFKNLHPLDGISSNEAREKSFAQFEKNGLPTKKIENWKYTSLTEFKNTNWSVAEAGEELLTHDQMQELSKQLPSDFINIVFINGILNVTLSDDLENVLSVADSAAIDYQLAQDSFEENLVNLSNAFLNKVITLKLNKHQQLDKPLQVVLVQSSKKSVYLSEKININMAENSELAVIINTLSFNNGLADAINVSLDIEMQKSARLQLVQLQNEDLSCYHFSQVNIKQHEESSLTSLVFSLGNKLARNYFHLNFLKNNANAQVYGLSVLDHDQHVDNYTYIQHSVGQNNSTQHYKSILSGSSHSVFRGRVRIEPNAQKANSEQLNNNLLLTKTAQADSVPQLEIFADDVKAGHGSTMGQLNKEEIFYFLSRGISQYKAVKMISYGYAKELIYKISNQNVQDYLIKYLNSKLEKMVQNA